MKIRETELGSTLYDDDGNVIAWLRTGACTNAACKRAIADMRPVHIIPAHTDPRAAERHLVMSTYHFATKSGAVAGLLRAWREAIAIDNIREAETHPGKALTVPRGRITE